MNHVLSTLALLIAQNNMKHYDLINSKVLAQLRGYFSLPELLQEANRHKILPLIVAALLENRFGFPLTADERFELVELKNSFIEYGKEYIQSISVIEEDYPHNKNHIYIKGIAHNYHAYNLDFSKRNPHDFDLLVNKAEALYVYDQLHHLGYQTPSWAYCNNKLRLDAFNHLTRLTKNDISIELHTRLTNSFDPHQMNYSRLFEYSKELVLHSHTIHIPDIVDTLYIACYHMYHEEYLDSDFSLKHIADILSLLGKVDIEDFYNRAHSDDCLFPIDYSFTICNRLYHELFGFNIIDECIVQKFCNNQDHDKIDHIKCELFLSYDTISIYPPGYSVIKRFECRNQRENSDEYRRIVENSVTSFIISQTWKNSLIRVGSSQNDMPSALWTWPKYTFFGT